MPLAGSNAVWTVGNGATFYNYNPNADLTVENVCNLNKITSNKQTIEGMCYGDGEKANTKLNADLLGMQFNSAWLNDGWREISYTVVAVPAE